VARVDECAVGKMKRVVLVDGVTDLRLFALILFDFVRHFNGQTIGVLPLGTGHRAEQVDQLHSVVEHLVALDVIAFASLVTEAECRRNDDLALLADAHAGHGAVHSADYLVLAQRERVSASERTLSGSKETAIAVTDQF
jgi:hypothetical protein